MKASKVNLFTGKRCRAINKSKVKDVNNNEYPELIVDAIRYQGKRILIVRKKKLG